VNVILLLEDDPLVMAYMRRILKQYKVIEAATAEEAFRLFNERGRQVDLLVANLTLPTSSGIEVALALRTELSNLPVIVTSGFPAGIWSRRNTAGLGRLGSDFVAIIEKPIQAQVFMNTVSRLLGAFWHEIARTA
jgi:response regulator RpfG family c-di-GMP phosphodiesterase